MRIDAGTLNHGLAASSPAAQHRRPRHAQQHRNRRPAGDPGRRLPEYFYRKKADGDDKQGHTATGYAPAPTVTTLNLGTRWSSPGPHHPDRQRRPGRPCRRPARRQHLGRQRRPGRPHRAGAPPHRHRPRRRANRRERPRRDHRHRRPRHNAPRQQPLPRPRQPHGALLGRNRPGLRQLPPGSVLTTCSPHSPSTPPPHKSVSATVSTNNAWSPARSPSSPASAFLASYTSDEDQYRALMAAGVTYAKAWNLIPGVALTEAQMAQPTTDIVWLVEQSITLADGRTRKFSCRSSIPGSAKAT